MAYIVDQVTATFAAASSVVMALPDHAESDMLLLCCSQDGGGTTIAASGWTVIGTQAASGACRQAWLYKVAGASEASPTITGANDEWVVTAMAVRDYSGGPSAFRESWNNVNTAVAPSQTTTANNALVLRSWISDSPAGDERLTVLPSQLVADVRETNELIHIIGHQVQEVAGATGTLTAYSEVNNEGGNAWTVVIGNSTGGGIDRYVAGGAQKIAWYGNFGIQHDIPVTGWTALSALAATIDGVTVSSTVSTVTATSVVADQADDLNARWGYPTKVENSESTAGAFVGGAHSLPAPVNMTGQLFALNWWGKFSNVLPLIGGKGFVVVFADSSDNWVAYQLTAWTSALKDVASQFAIISLGTATPLDSGGTIDWSDINRIGYGFHKVGSTASARAIIIRNAFLHNPPVLVGGCPAKPLDLAFAAQALTGWATVGTAQTQGSAQVLTRVGVQIGDGTKTTYFDARGSAHEFPLPRSVRRSRYAWNVAENAMALTVYASPNDTIKFRSTITTTTSRQRFDLHASSSTAADYDFAGATIVGYEVTWRAGITCNAASFVNGYTITANGGTFDGCVIQGSVADVALRTADPSKITDCEFISGGSGHAIEITTPGTYSFVGNTFAGYGADGSADAAIYNNSGGAVTLNVSGGGDTPTVRNGAGSTTTIVSGASLTLTGVIPGSDIVILDAGTNTERVDIDQHPTSTYVYSYTVTGDVDICLYLAGHKPYIVRGYTLSTSDSSLPIAQVLDRNYSNP